MKLFLKISIFFILFTNFAKANESSDWLKSEIDNILNTYNNDSISNEQRFEAIENSINKNFAGAGIAKFVAGKSWGSANKDTKREYVKLFKRHLALNIASMMQGYSNQNYNLISNKYDEKSKVYLIDMNIEYDTGSLLVTWRVKESKNKFFVIDLLVADISLVVTKRSEFNSLLKKEGFKLKNFNKILKSQNEISYKKLIQ